MTVTRKRRTRIFAGAAAVAAGLGLAASALPAQAIGTGNPYDDIQVGVTYTVYQPTFTNGLATPKKATDSGECSKGTEQNLVVGYGPKAAPAFVVYEGNPICSDPPEGPKVAAVNVSGATAKVFAFCDPGTRCTRKDVKRVGGMVLVTLPATSSLRRVSIEIITDGRNAISANKLIKVARSLQPVQ